MKVLVVSTDGKLVVTGPLWRHMREHLAFDHEVVVREAGLEKFFLERDLSGYDRVVADTNLRRLGKRYRALKNAPGLIVFDHDVCQNNVRTSEWYRRYPSILRDLGAVRLITSGYMLCRQMRAEGIDTGFHPKAFDDEVIHHLDIQRDIPCAFVGRVKNKVYRERKKFLEQAQKRFGIPVLRAEPGAPYNELLNRIRVFVSADIGFGEYMIKNFEAMAAGCLLVAWRQAPAEQEALGLVEGENVLLYESMDELGACLDWVRDNPDAAEVVAARGRELAVSRHSWRHRAPEFAALLGDPPRAARPNGLRDKIRLMGA